MKRKSIAIIGICSLLAVVIFWFSNKTPLFADEALTSEELATIVENRYNGDIQQMKEVNGTYTIDFERDSLAYQIEMASSTGEVLNLVRTSGEKTILSEEEIKTRIEEESLGDIQALTLSNKSGEEVYIAEVIDSGESREVLLHPVTGKVLSNEQKEYNKPSNTILSEAEAIDIALQSVQGEVEDVDLESEGERIFYLIEIETADDKEAIVEVNAITGESTITWD